ncbi:hypothetical protein AL035_21845, partial [Salipiger aestuarii]
HRLAISFLQVPEPLFVLLADVARVGAQRILHAALRVLAPPLISEGVGSKDRIASDSVVSPWMISITKAVFRFAVHRLTLSPIVILIAAFSPVA